MWEDKTEATAFRHKSPCFLQIASVAKGSEGISHGQQADKNAVNQCAEYIFLPIRSLEHQAVGQDTGEYEQSA